MGRNYYISSSGTLRRKQNTIYLENEAGKRPIPVEDVDAFYIFGEVTLNTKLLDFLAQKHIPVHFFNYYDYYSGSYYPREYLNSGFLLVQQVSHYTDLERRMVLARETVNSACHNLLRNLKYYKNRVEAPELGQIIEAIEAEQEALTAAADPLSLMAIEGRIRERYYRSFNFILNLDEPFVKRVKRPPDNVINTLISFGNSLLYATTLSEIYRTQLNPTVSFLHEPGERRFSLSLDISEIFKPLIVDRVIFKLVNNRMLKEKHFERDLNYCYLKEEGRDIFLRQYDERLNQTIQHRQLRKHVSYQRLIRLECYKLIKHLSGTEDYQGFKMWW
ncbi:MAG: type I-B CRISPR-associated endonuclease Cas1b [Candidatus Bipolaricaulia bacterium]